MASDFSGSLEAHGPPLPPCSEDRGLCDITPEADDFVNNLIERIGPQDFSIWTRDIVVDYAKGVIRNCFAAEGVEVRCFLFGSVPLKTYLPDGDIDIGIVQKSGRFVDGGWMTLVKSAFEAQIPKNLPNLPASVKSVETVQAEVKLVKCVINNIVVDISFNSFNGLCTLLFLEDVDLRIAQRHLFKRSVILIKGWCCYDSRLLGAQHALLSTYALETLVLAVFNIYGRLLTSPLQVFKAFMMVFSNFDFSKYCVSIDGMIPLNSFPEKRVEPFREATEPLFLDELFSSETLRNYSPQGVGGWDKPREWKLKMGTMHIMDPLLDDNNLGKGISFMSTERFCGAVKLTHEQLSRALDQGSDTTSAVAVLGDIFAGSLRACITAPSLFVGTSSVSGKSIMVYARSEDDLDIPSLHDYVTSPSYPGPHAGSDAIVGTGRPGGTRGPDSPEADGQSPSQSTASSSMDPDLNYLQQSRSAMRENEAGASSAETGLADQGVMVGSWSTQRRSHFDGPPPTSSPESGGCFPGGGEENSAFMFPGGREVVGPVTPAGVPPTSYVYEQDSIQLDQPQRDMYYDRAPGPMVHSPQDYQGWYQTYAGEQLYQYLLGNGLMLSLPPPTLPNLTGHPGTANDSTYGFPQHPVRLLPPALLGVPSRELGSLEPYSGSEDILAGDRDRMQTELTEVKEHLLTNDMPGGPNTPSTDRSGEASVTSGATTPPTTPQSLSPLTTGGRVHKAIFPPSGGMALPGNLDRAPDPVPGRPLRGSVLDTPPGGVGRGHDGQGKTVWQNKADRPGTNRAPRGSNPPTMALGRPVGNELDNFPALRDSTAGRTEFGMQAQRPLRGPGATPPMPSLLPRPPLRNAAPPPAMPPSWTFKQSISHDGASSEYQAGMGQQARRPRVPGASQNVRHEGFQSDRSGVDPTAPRPPQTGASSGRAQSDRGDPRPLTGRISTAPRPAGTLDSGTERAARSHRPGVKGGPLLESPGGGPIGRPEARDTHLGDEAGFSRTVPGSGVLAQATAHGPWDAAGIPSAGPQSRGSAGGEAALQTRQSSQLYDTEFPSLSNKVEKKRG